MKVNHTTYEFEGHILKWGMTFKEVTEILSGIQRFNPYGGWPNERYTCRSVFGISSTEFEIRAPLSNRPVMQIQYELSPIKSGSFEELHVPYLEKLKPELGEPTSISSSYHNHAGKKEYNSDRVVFCAKWMIEDIRFTLSVYGGIREKDSGEAGAGLFIDWTNEVLAGKPYRAERREFEALVEKNLLPGQEVTTYELTYSQKPFCVIHYALDDPYIAQKDLNLRLHQMALYKEDLFRTPGPIRDKLSEKEIACYFNEQLQLWFISNKWDSVSFAEKEIEKIAFIDVLPARGGGGKNLGVKGLRVEDSRDGTELERLVSKLEDETGLAVQRFQIYDE